MQIEYPLNLPSGKRVTVLLETDQQYKDINVSVWDNTDSTKEYTFTNLSREDWFCVVSSYIEKIPFSALDTKY